jgi:hypothetical protein
LRNANGPLYTFVLVGTREEADKLLASGQFPKPGTVEKKKGRQLVSPEAEGTFNRTSMLRAYEYSLRQLRCFKRYNPTRV